MILMIRDDHDDDGKCCNDDGDSEMNLVMTEMIR